MKLKTGAGPHGNAPGGTPPPGAALAEKVQRLREESEGLSGAMSATQEAASRVRAAIKKAKAKTFVRDRDLGDEDPQEDA